MAKISAYPNGTTPQSSDYFVIARGGQNYKLNWSSLEAEQLSIMQDTKDPTGWVSPELITVSYDATSRKITLTGTLEYYWRGVKTTLTSPWTSDAHDSADGRYFLYSTDGVTFAWSTDTWEFYELMVAIARKKTTPAYQFGLREPHGLMPWQVHRELHETLSAYRVSGGGLTIGTYAENTASDAATTPGFDALVMADEDIETTITAWLQGTYTTLRIGASSVSTFDTTASFPFRSSGSYILINDPATGAEAAGANNNYVNVYIIRIPTTSDTGSQSYRLVCLQPQRAYTSLAAAQAEDTRSLSLGDVGNSLPEFVFYERITYILASGDANTGKCRIATGGISYIFGTRMSQISAGGVGAVQTAENTPFTPTGGISASNVQAAVVELDTEKAALASPTFTGTPAAPTAASGTNTTQLATTAFVQGEKSEFYDSSFDIYRNNAVATSVFIGTIATLPGGATLTYNVSSGNESAMVPLATTQLAKMRLWNTTKNSYALISDCNIATNTITLTANVPAGWATTDVITIASQTVSGGGVDWVELEIVSEITGKSGLLMTTRVSGTALDSIFLHPLSAFATGKTQSYFVNATGVPYVVQTAIAITSNVFAIAWIGTSVSIILRIVKVEP